MDRKVVSAAFLRGATFVAAAGVVCRRTCGSSAADDGGMPRCQLKLAMLRTAGLRRPGPRRRPDPGPARPGRLHLRCGAGRTPRPRAAAAGLTLDRCEVALFLRIRHHRRYRISPVISAFRHHPVTSRPWDASTAGRPDPARAARPMGTSHARLLTAEGRPRRARRRPRRRGRAVAEGSATRPIRPPRRHQPGTGRPRSAWRSTHSARSTSW